MIRSYKVRIYPTKEQEVLMNKHINCCRFIWNYMLDLNLKCEELGEYRLSHFEMNKKITPLKKQPQYQWLNEVSVTSLQIICGDLSQAYKKFFNGICRKPKFKKKVKAKRAFPIAGNRTYFKSNKLVILPIIGKVEYKTDFNFQYGTNALKFINPRVSNIGNKWILTFGLEVEKQDYNLNDFSVGIDLGIKDLAVVSYDDNKSKVYHNINKSKKVKYYKSKLKHIQRNLSRKYEKRKSENFYNKEMSKNEIRELKRLQYLYRKLTNIRDNYIHQATAEIVNMLPKRIVIEDLKVSKMLKDKRLSEEIQEQCFYKFREYLTYKCEEKGIELVLANRFYPSSKTCSCCGNIKKTLKLSDRTYICDKCGFTIDRDLNAARNLMNYIPQ